LVKYGIWLAARAGSRLSVAAPPEVPTFMVPPRTGPAALAALDSSRLAALTDTPSNVSDLNKQDTTYF
jgi:hypothetical protein